VFRRQFSRFVRMKIALLIVLVSALAMLTFAQEPTLRPPIRLKSINAETAQSEVHIEINLSLPVASPRWLMIQGNSLVLDLPGVTYDQDGKRLVVDRNSVRDVVVSLHQQAPPLTRITITMSRLQPYKLSTDGNRVVLEIGPHAQALENRTGPVPTARVGIVDRVFRRAPKSAVPPTREQPSSTAQSVPPPAPLPPLRLPEPTTREQGGRSSSGEVALADKNATAETPPVAPAAAASASRALTALLLPAVRIAPRELMWAGNTPTFLRGEPASAKLEPPVATAPAIAAEPRAAVVVPNPDLRTLFHVKFVQQDVAYIDAGRNEDITEGTKLVVVDGAPKGASPNNTSPAAAVAELTVIGVAETSAVTEIHVLQREVVPGDVAYLSDTDLQALVQQRALSSTRKYPAVISFTEDDDALDEEVRLRDVPRPPLPSVNRMRGRIGFDYFGTHSLDASQANGRDLGVVLRADFTRIGGTYWNFQGYYRGTLDSTSAASETTLQQTISRTYHLGLIYDNPTGRWVAGFGRLYLPWASSLDTIDGGYFGGRIHSSVIAGIFAGSTPDPTSWNYAPNRQIGGTFVNFSGGSFDAFHYSSTGGVGISLLSWQVDRPFVFLENSLSYRRDVSVYSALQADSPAGNAAVAAPGAGIGSSFLTMRWSPVQRLQLDFNHTYFRNIPTFDPTLIGTGLLDKYLFQGFSGGAHLDLLKQITVYTELGRSNRTGDSNTALNEMYGITFGRVPWLELHADAHYSRFNSSFGSGSYRAGSLSRNVNERLRLEILLGDQSFTSTLAGNQSAKFVTATVENDVGSYLFTEAGFTIYRGQQQNYNQWMLTLGYRFDSRWKRK
jgi:AMIN domain